MPLIFYSGEDEVKLFTWCIFSILATYLSWEAGSYITKRASKIFPLLNCPLKHFTVLVLSFLLLTIIIILSIYLVNRLFNTAGDDYWHEMQAVHLTILFGTFLLISMHEGIDIYLTLRDITMHGKSATSSTGQETGSLPMAHKESKPEILKDKPENGNSVFRKNFTVQVGSRIKVVPVSEIAYLYARDKGVYLRTFSNRDYPVDFSLTEFCALLDPGHFIRINRKFIVSLESISELVTLSHSKLKVKLSPPSPFELIIGHPKSAELKAWLNR